MSISATPVGAAATREYPVRGRSTPTDSFSKALAGAVSSRRDSEPARAATAAPVASASVATTSKPAETIHFAGNPFAASTPTPALASKPPAAAAEPKATSWSPWNGPCDPRDAIPGGGGLLTASGAPLITPNTVATRNQYNYAGPAAKNPYFTNPGNPLREGYVNGFSNWFMASPSVSGAGTAPTAANSAYYATEEGAKEALRLVQQYEPGATLTSRTWGGGPYLSNQPMFVITMPSGRELNAGGILESYYNHGCGVSIYSDMDLETTVRNA